MSAGIDMGLTLAAAIAGDETAKAIPLLMEYDPQPPFDCGSVAKAPAEIVTSMRAEREITIATEEHARVLHEGDELVVTNQAYRATYLAVHGGLDVPFL